MKKVKIGNIDGHDIYADVGRDEMELLRHAITNAVQKHRATAGKQLVMVVDTAQGRVMVKAEVMEYPYINLEEDI